MSPTIYLITLGLIIGTVLAVFAMKYLSAALAARARVASDDAYRALAEKASAAEAENGASLAAIRGELTRVATSLAAVEKVLKQVG